MSIILWVPGVISWIFGTIFSVVTFIWSIIGSIWTIFVLILNIVYGWIMLLIFLRMPSNMAKFVQLFVLLIILPLIVNCLLTDTHIAINLLLPIYLTLFVFQVGDYHRAPRESPKVFRNIVFFTIICAFL